MIVGPIEFQLTVLPFDNESAEATVTATWADGRPGRPPLLQTNNPVPLLGSNAVKINITRSTARRDEPVCNFWATDEEGQKTMVVLQPFLDNAGIIRAQLVDLLV